MKTDCLKYNNYTATIHYSTEDEVFFGKVLGINDLISFQGSSVDELRIAFQESIEDYLETCTLLAKTPNKEYKGAFNIRLTPSLHKMVAENASLHQMNLNEYVKNALMYVVKHDPEITTNKDYALEA